MREATRADIAQVLKRGGPLSPFLGKPLTLRTASPPDLDE